MTRAISFLVSLCAFVVMTGCLRDAPIDVNRATIPARLEKLGKPPAPNPNEQEDKKQEERPDKDSIAKQVEAKIRNTPFAEVTAIISLFDKNFNTVEPSFLAVSYMAKDAFKLRVYEPSGKIRRMLGLVDGIVEEYPVPTTNAPEEYEVDPKTPHGIAGAKYALQSDCWIGFLHFSWFGVPEKNSLPPAMDFARSMRLKIERGVQLPDAPEGNCQCYVFRQTILYDDGDKVVNTVYVDKATMYVVRWDLAKGSGIVAVRHFFVHPSDTVPSDFDWKLPRSYPEPPQRKRVEAV